jgi:hypothetical protein
MTEATLKNVISVILVVSHALTLLIVLTVYILHGLTDEQTTTTVGMVVPMLATIVGLAVNHIIASKRVVRGTSPKVSKLYVFGVVFFAVLYILTIVVLLLLKAFNLGITFEAFKISMGIAQTIFGAYTGKVLSSLFDPAPARKDG